MKDASRKDRLAASTAAVIRATFDEYATEFLRITRRAKRRFEKRDWKGRRRDTLRRLDLYERALDKINVALSKKLGARLTDRTIWTTARDKYSDLIAGRHDSELAETFFNSVTRKVLQTVGIDREIEYFHLGSRPAAAKPAQPVYRRYDADTETRRLIRQILEDYGFKVPYEDIERDAELVGREVDLHLWPIVGYGKIDAIEMIRAPFYRNKVAYLLGRIKTDSQIVPMVLPLYNGERGLYVDTALLIQAEVSIVFSFAHNYFHIEVERHDALIDFLRSIVPRKPVAELYISIGYNKHGKTEFYRDLHRFVHESKELFVIAPGKEGAVMIAFTLPDYGFVFKVIKDHPCFLRTSDVTTKTITRSEVMYRYDLVCHRDRVGRMVDTQEFENLRFRKWRFSDDLLREFSAVARGAVAIEDEYVVVHHLYVQRKVIPLPMYLLDEKNPDAIRRVIIDFGYFLKDLAATGIFPSDLFNTWNYGVTRRGRVVLFDYDDVIPLEQASFREKPAPRDEYEELAAEEQYVAATPDDFFIDEMDRYSGIPLPLKGIFKSVHADLFTLEFWQDMKRRVRHGELVDITPYDRSRRFRNRNREYDER